MTHVGTLDPFSTPTVKLERLFGRPEIEVFAKLDLLQLSGSTKERTASSLIGSLMASGRLEPGGLIVESTSGNLGIALARQSGVRGIGFVAVVDENANRSALELMRAYGARIELVRTPVDGNKLAARRQRVQELLGENPGAVTTNQYGSPDNPDAHFTTTMPEFMDAVDGRLDMLFVATSTTGTLLGCQRYLRLHHPETKLVAVDAVGSVLFGGEEGVRRFPGLGAGIVPELALQADPDVVCRIDEIDMVRGCRMLARREGILAGASTGAIVAAMGRDLPGIEEGTRIGFLVHDSGVPYLHTVYDDDWVRSNLGSEPEPDTVAEVLGASPR
ncbi:cysteine synthase family protein [Paeniglutamicibacter sp. ABSL32-1]|uniref:pyridoxal-phosphate dependent enzyme n=1 Tax=Paeniglutamicibacter quisquiliarum TaxID=2849498 RepID=UPI001C2D1B95|nr:pyridoxal-phosphate dependent enzyme [Paeniglutamicibacter quisquiliarum]MBV1780219.1 cysteine synthase family protein [Paeniglutamicibacter quisquiliarum]